MKRKVFVLTGNTGTGKTTVANYLQDFYEMPRVITHTTRLPRDGEMDQVDYYFESMESFQNNHYLETVTYDGQQYGSSWEGLERAWEKNPLITIVLDTAGAVTYADALGSEAVIIYLTVSQPNELMHRLERRGDNVDEMKQRLASSEFQRDNVLPVELQGKATIIVNDDWEATRDRINEIVQAKIEVEE